jgi:uncharacterized protein YuzE
MKMSYDADVDAVYLELLRSEPDGVIEVAEGIHIDVTSDGRIVGIELLDASKKVSIGSLLTYEIDADGIETFRRAVIG